MFYPVMAEKNEIHYKNVLFTSHQYIKCLLKNKWKKWKGHKLLQKQLDGGCTSECITVKVSNMTGGSLNCVWSVSPHFNLYG